MIVEWKHRKAEAEVDPLLASAGRLDPQLLLTFPRPLKDILCSALPIAFESHRHLTLRTIRDVLGDVYGVDDHEGLDTGDGPVAGFSFARGETAVVFSDPQYGDGFERFTIAHEAAHLAVEYLPRIGKSRQAELFGGVPAPPFYARRDPPAHFFMGNGGAPPKSSDLWQQYSELRADHDAWLREVIANACAAELLTPYRELERFIRSLPAQADHQAKVQARFGLSRRAAEVRLAEFGLAEAAPSTLLFLSE